MASRAKPKESSFETLWVACDLNDQDKAALKARKLNYNEMMGGISALIDAHFRITISFDERADCVGAYLTAPKEKATEKTRCLSARGHTLDHALQALLYKHYEKLGEDWSGSVKENGLVDPWG